MVGKGKRGMTSASGNVVHEGNIQIAKATQHLVNTQPSDNFEKFDNDRTFYHPLNIEFFKHSELETFMLREVPLE
ncbi:MAG: hypothetical protein ACI9R3_002131 [Verrucomicrobiales bacterium]|jgi:hypothetical protein